MDHPLPPVDSFSGKNPDQSAARWIRSIELHPFKDVPTFLAFVDTKLSGPAAEWADQTPEIRMILDDSTAGDREKKIFRERFLFRWHTVAQPDALIDSTPLEQRKGESIPDYYRRVLARLHQVGGRDEAPKSKNSVDSRSNDYILQQHMEMFRHGLKDDRLAFELGKKGAATLDEAAQYVLQLSSFYRRVDIDPLYNSLEFLQIPLQMSRLVVTPTPPFNVVILKNRWYPDRWMGIPLVRTWENRGEMSPKTGSSLRSPASVVGKKGTIPRNVGAPPNSPLMTLVQ
jgi:hypothetical protein